MLLNFVRQPFGPRFFWGMVFFKSCPARPLDRLPVGFGLPIGDLLAIYWRSLLAIPIGDLVAILFFSANCVFRV